MSLLAIQWAWQQHASAGAKFVLLALADYADQYGSCFPSQRKLAQKCGLSRSTINVHLQYLLSVGLISIQHRNNHSGYRRSSLYRLELSQSPDSGDSMSEIQTGLCPESGQHRTSNILTSHKNLIRPKSGHRFSSADKPALKDAL